jgi:hypothetical protein
LWCALRTWRQVTGLALAWIAESHWHNGNAALVIEILTIELHPASQSVTAGIIPRDAGLVYAGTGRLPDNKNASAAAGTQYRVGTER